MNIKLYTFALPCLALAALPALAGTPIDKTVAADPDGVVHIANVSGSIKVTTWDNHKVHIGGTLGKGSERLAVESTEAGVSIRVVLPEHGRNIEGSQLVIQLPASSQLHVKAVSADVTVTGATGPVRLKSVSGDIDLSSQSADIDIKSVSGELDINGSAANSHVDVQTISGSIEIEGISGELRVESVSGDIEVSDSGAISRAKLGTTSGDIGFAAQLSKDGDYEFNSVSGDIRLHLPKTPELRFSASSLSGDIVSNFGPQPASVSEYGPGKQWHYLGGKGKACVNLHTMSGDIRISADDQ